MSTRDNPYRASQHSIARVVTIRNTWKEGPYLVVHATRSSAPDGCLFCGARGDWRGNMVVNRPITAPLVLGLVVFFPISLLFYSLRPKAKVEASLCLRHARKYNTIWWTIYAPMWIALGSLILLLSVGLGIIPYSDDRLFSFLGLYLLGLIIWIVAALASLAAKRPVTVLQHQRNYYWLAGVPASLLDDVPDISTANKE